MNTGTLIIFAGIFCITLGTVLTYWGQSINNAKDSKATMAQYTKAIDEQNEQIAYLQKQSDVLGNIGTSQLRATFYTEQLNDPVRSLYFRISLKKPTSFDQLKPLHFAFELKETDKKTIFRRYVTHGGAKMMRGGNEVPAENYDIKTLSTEDASETRSFNYGTMAPVVKDIRIPVKLDEEILLRDFHDEMFHAYINDDLLDKVEFIELIVNGWVFLHATPESVHWRDRPMARMSGWQKFPYKELTLKDAISNPQTELWDQMWRLDLMSEIPTFYKKLSFKEIRFTE